MSRTISMNEHGSFTVSDDPEGVIVAALLVATNNRNAPQVSVELSPEGNGLRIPGVGSINRARSRDELPAPFDEDPSFDPETEELWRLFRAPDHAHSGPGRFVLRGDELRDLVARALLLRRR